MLDHEYSLIGHSRSHVGRWLGVSASLTAGLLTTGIIALIGWFNTKLADAPDYIVLPAIAGIAYTALHYAFNKIGWRLKGIKEILGFPDLAGKWVVSGQTLNNKNEIQHEWSGEITIVQTWEKICVSQKTPNSTSKSLSASLTKRADEGYLLMYSYSNEPGIGLHNALHAHIGYCEIIFDKNCREATGEYFNNRGRTSFGRVRLERKKESD